MITHALSTISFTYSFSDEYFKLDSFCFRVSHVITQADFVALVINTHFEFVIHPKLF